MKCLNEVLKYMSALPRVAKDCDTELNHTPKT